MNRNLFLLAFIALLSSSPAMAQRLEMHRTVGGAHFMLDTLYISHRQVSEIVSIDPQASHEFKAALKNYRVGGILGFGGAIILAIPVVNAVAGGEPEWLMAGGGVVLLVASLPFSRAFKSHAQLAIDGYNLRQVDQRTSLLHNRRPPMKLQFTGNGFALKF